MVRGEQTITLPAVRPFRDLHRLAETPGQQMQQSVTGVNSLPVSLLPRLCKWIELLKRAALEHGEASLALDSTTTSDALKNIARQHHLTLNTVVQGAWSLLLSRYSGEEDVLLARPFPGGLPICAVLRTWSGCSSIHCLCE
jgi:hypothetical protein